MNKHIARRVYGPIFLRGSRQYSQIIRVNTASAPASSLNVAEALSHLPEISGSGPFPDTPKFKVLGDPPTLLQISLPASAELRMRKGSIVAINGLAPEELSTSLSVDGTIADLAKAVPLAFQKVVSSTPTSLLVSSTSISSSPITVVDIDTEAPWIVSQRDSILGWSSSSVNLTSNSSFKRWGELRATGKGQLALTGQGEIFKIELEPGEQVLLNPANVIAYKSSVRSDNDGILLKIPKTQNVYTFELPKLSGKWAESFVHATSAFTDNPVVKRLTLWLKRLFGQDNVMFQVNGPKTLLLQTRGEKVSNLFTHEELNRILSLHKRA